MFCSNCGTNIPDGSLFCPGCGQKTAQPTSNIGETTVLSENQTQVLNDDQKTILAEEQSVVYNENYVPESFAQEEQTQYAQSEYAQPEYAEPEQNAYANTSFEEEPPVKKKKGKKIVKTVIFSVISLALVAAIVLNYNFIWGYLVKWFGSDASYAHYTQKLAMAELIDGTSTIYGDYILGEAGVGKGSAEAKVSIKINDQILDMLEQSMGNAGMDLSWLSNLGIKANSASNGDVISSDIGITLSDKTLASFKIIEDFKNGVFYLALPGIIDEYISVDISQMNGGMSMEQAFEMLENVKTALPREQFADILTRYTTIAIDAIEDVEISSETVEIEGVEQSLTVIESTINGETVAKMVEAIFREMLEDADIEQIMTSMQDSLEDMGAEFGDEDLYEEFAEGIDEALDEIEELESELEEFEIVITQYVNASHKTVGFALSSPLMKGDDIVSCVNIEDGSEFACEYNLGSIEIIGKGKTEGGKMSGSYDLESYGTALGTISFSDVSEQGADELSGKLTISLGEGLLEELLGADASAIGSFFKPSLDIEYSGTQDAPVIKMSFMGMLEMTVSGAISEEVPEISVPDDAYDAQTEAEEWLSGMDLQGLLDALEEAGVPQEIVQVLSYMTMM